MAKQKKKVSASTKAEQNADQLLSKTDQFLDKHLKEVVIGASIVVVIVLAFLGVRHFYLIPQERKAEDAIFRAEQQFGMRQWESALMGDSIGNYGFLDVIDDFGSTQSGNLAKAYAGMCYFHMGDYENALDYLKKYKTKEKLTGSTVIGMMGDSYANLGNKEEAIKQFNKAATTANNELVSPIFLKKAAETYKQMGRYQEAIDILKQIQDKYPTSTEARTVEKEIIRNQELQKQQ